MKYQPKIVIENDVFTRVLDVVLNESCESERRYAFADFFSHDVPDFLSWADNLRKNCQFIEKSQIQFIETQSELQASLHDADLVILESLELGRQELQLAKKLKAVYKYGFITRNIDTAVCEELGIQVLTVRRRANVACAEQAMMMMLALAKRLTELNGLTSMKRLQDAGFSPAPFFRKHTPSSNWARVSGISCLQDATIGIIGMGEIGREIAKRAKSFEMKIIYTQRSPLQREVEEEFNAAYLPLNELLSKSDWIIAQLPATPATHNLLNSNNFKFIKKGARLINVSRAQCMERSAVIQALAEGHLGGFALDTLWEEPGQDDDELLSFPNVILTPHMAGSPRYNAIADFEEMINHIDAIFSNNSLGSYHASV